MGRRGTMKPCHGCGEADKWRPTDEVCRDCKALLAEAKAIVAREDAAERLARDEASLDDYLGIGVDTGGGRLNPMTVEHKPKNWAWNGYYLKRGQIHHTSAPRALAEAMNDLAFAISEQPRRRITDSGIRKMARDWVSARRFAPGVANKVVEVDRLIREAMQAAYDAGLKRGSSVLHGVADGSLAPDDLAKLR